MELSVIAPHIDQDRQALARSYARDRLLLRGAGLGLSLLALLVLLPLGGATALQSTVQSISEFWPFQIALFFAILAALWGIALLPLTYVRGYLLPHRYGLSTQTLSAWAADLLKGAALGAVLGGVAVELLYLALRWSPDLWWLWTAVGYLAISVLLTSLAPVLILPLFFRLQALEDAAQRDAILRLADQAGTRIRAVCQINLSSKTPAANAAVIGLGRTRRIVLGDTLLASFPPDEVEVVVAHELGHHVHHDLPKGITLSAVTTLLGFGVANLVLHAAVGGGHFRAVCELAAFPVLALALGIWSAFADIVNLAASRAMESAADAYSLHLTGAAEAFIGSEIRLTNQNLAWFRPPLWLELLTYSHPAPWRRVAMGERYSSTLPAQEEA